MRVKLLSFIFIEFEFVFYFQQKEVDMRILNLTTMKKKQQEHLQQLLATNAQETLSSIASSPTVPLKTVITNLATPSRLQISKTLVSNSNINAKVINRALSMPVIKVKQDSKSQTQQLKPKVNTPPPPLPPFAPISQQPPPPPSSPPVSTSPLPSTSLIDEIKRNNQQDDASKQIETLKVTNKNDLIALERLLINKSTIINKNLRDRIENLKLKSLVKEKCVSSSSISTQLNNSHLSSNTSTTNHNTSISNIRPNIFVSNETNQKLQQFAIDKYTYNLKLNNKINAQVPDTSAVITIASNNKKLINKIDSNLDENKILNSINKSLLDTIEYLSKDYPYIHIDANSIAFKDLNLSANKCYFSGLSENFTFDKNICDVSVSEPVKIANITNYESPLLMFRGYR